MIAAWRPPSIRRRADVRLVVIGIGAVGGVIAARLHQSGQPVLGVARGEHGRVTDLNGLTVTDPTGSTVVDLPVTTALEPGTLRADDAVLLCVKSHQTAAALDQLQAAWPHPLPVVCVQNGVANEAAVLRFTPDVVACNVLMPSTHLEPGHVEAHWHPISGVLDVGTFHGDPTVAHRVAEALAAATFASAVLDDIMAWKHAKLLMNLGNVAEALVGPRARSSAVTTALSEEGAAVLAAAGIPVVDVEQLYARRFEAGEIVSTGDGRGGSTWQSVQRGATELETPYLNGEIALIARRHGSDAPLNANVAEVARRRAMDGTLQQPLTDEDLLQMIQPA
jgi:2-dehydropantoate 2-reductase